MEYSSKLSSRDAKKPKWSGKPIKQFLICSLRKFFSKFSKSFNRSLGKLSIKIGIHSRSGKALTMNLV